MRQSLITNWLTGPDQQPLTQNAVLEGSGLPPFVDFSNVKVKIKAGVITATADGNELGELELYEDNNGGQWVQNIGVESWARRRGIATMLIEKAIDEYGHIYASTQTEEEDTQYDSRHLTPEGRALVEGLIKKGIMKEEWLMDPIR